MSAAVPSARECHAPTLPCEVYDAVQQSLGIGPPRVWQMAGGINARTFLADIGTYSWIIRVEPANGTQLRRAFSAQQIARNAGVSVPEITAWELGISGHHRYVWTVEEYVDGVTFDQQLAASNALHIAADLGTQLRRLHDVPAEAFGLLAPNPYTTYTSFEAWINDEAQYIPEAVHAAELDEAMIPLLEEVYAQLRAWYRADARLCHGDCGGANMLVQDTRIAALVDWEWAGGGDPASDIAYWLFWRQDPAALEALLNAYEPSDAATFRQRIEAYQVVHAVHLIAVFSACGDIWSIGSCRAKLEQSLGLLHNCRVLC
jgi:aminoglycoside phosphotransferase (APT) family kinase protein